MKRNKVTSIASSTCNPWNPTVSTFLKWVTSFWFPVKVLSNLMKSKVILLEWTKVNGTFVGLRPERSRPIRRSRQEWILTDLICKQRDRQMITPGLWSLSLIHSAADSQRLITAGDREIASLAARNCCISVRLNFKCETADLSPILPLYCGSHWVLCKIIEVTRTENWVFLRELPAQWCGGSLFLQLQFEVFIALTITTKPDKDQKVSLMNDVDWCTSMAMSMTQ